MHELYFTGVSRPLLTLPLGHASEGSEQRVMASVHWDGGLGTPVLHVSSGLFNVIRSKRNGGYRRAFPSRGDRRSLITGLRKVCLIQEYTRFLALWFRQWWLS